MVPSDGYAELLATELVDDVVAWDHGLHCAGRFHVDPELELSSIARSRASATVGVRWARGRRRCHPQPDRRLEPFPVTQRVV